MTNKNCNKHIIQIMWYLNDSKIDFFVLAFSYDDDDVVDDDEEKVMNFAIVVVDDDDKEFSFNKTWFCILFIVMMLLEFIFTSSDHYL